MAMELCYTSVPRGLKPGTCGFCTVACTQGIPVNLARKLEALSGYRHLFPPGSPQAARNPVVYSHVTFVLGGHHYHVLSRICDAGLDYSGRTNKFAHHVVLDRKELPAAGPAWLLSQPGFVMNTWQGEPRILPPRRSIPQGNVEPQPCDSWQQLAGDTGWAGLLAETMLSPEPKPSYLVAAPGMDVFRLYVEALQLLPPELRWKATFTTYYMPLPPDVNCLWRCVYDGTPEATKARRRRDVLVIDLTHPQPVPQENYAVQAARKGDFVSPPKPAVPTIEKAHAEDAALGPVVAGMQDQSQPEPYQVGPPPIVQPSQSMIPQWAQQQEVLQPRSRVPQWLIILTVVNICLLLLLGTVALLTVSSIRRGLSPLAGQVAHSQTEKQTTKNTSPAEEGTQPSDRQPTEPPNAAPPQRQPEGPSEQNKPATKQQSPQPDAGKQQPPQTQEQSKAPQEGEKSPQSEPPAESSHNGKNPTAEQQAPTTGQKRPNESQKDAPPAPRSPSRPLGTTPAGIRLPKGEIVLKQPEDIPTVLAKLDNNVLYLYKTERISGVPIGFIANRNGTVEQCLQLTPPQSHPGETSTNQSGLPTNNTLPISIPPELPRELILENLDFANLYIEEVVHNTSTVRTTFKFSERKEVSNKELTLKFEPRGSRGLATRKVQPPEVKVKLDGRMLEISCENRGFSSPLYRLRGHIAYRLTKGESTLKIVLVKFPDIESPRGSNR